MNKSEVVRLLFEIKQNYPFFDTSEENVERHYKFLHDFPFEAARDNVDQHILTGKYPPNIAEIRGGIGDQLDRQREKEETDAYFAKLELWRQNASPPPDGLRDRVMSLLRGDSA